MTNATPKEKPDAGNPRVRIDEVEVASYPPTVGRPEGVAMRGAKPGRGFLLCKTILPCVALALFVLPAPCAERSEVVFTKPSVRWLWGGFGFNNIEATMTPMMSDEFRDERAVKTFREISPTFARVYAGYAAWTTNAMDRFADYYDATFRRAGTVLYFVPGRMPVIQDDFNARSYAANVATRLEYLVKSRNCTKVRYYGISNELSVGPTFNWFGMGHLDLFAEICRNLNREFANRGLDIGLMTTDSSSDARDAELLLWAFKNLVEESDAFCCHTYVKKVEPGDLSAYPHYYATFTNFVRKTMWREKRVALGEYGFVGFRNWLPGAMKVDAPDGWFDPKGEKFARVAMSTVELGLAAMNAGLLCAADWTFCDYPDPFLREDGDTPEEKARYDACRFSGAGIQTRYNKWGLFRWNEDGHDYSAYPKLYAMGYLAKLFRKGARVLPGRTDDPTIRLGGVTNPDGSASYAILNWGEAKTVAVRSEHAFTQPLRVYEYDSARVPEDVCNDLQPTKGRIVASDGMFSATVPACSLTFFTTDYVDRTPSPVTGVTMTGGRLSWAASPDAEHVYYRVFKNGQKVRSTVATSCAVDDANATYTVKSVDKWGNMR